jgi:hypothetical protein
MSALLPILSGANWALLEIRFANMTDILLTPFRSHSPQPTSSNTKIFLSFIERCQLVYSDGAAPGYQG